MRRRVISSLLVIGCLVLPMLVHAGSAQAGPAVAPVVPTTAEGAATGVIVASDGPLDAESVRRVEAAVGRDVVDQTPLGDSQVSLRFDEPVAASDVRRRDAALDAVPHVGEIVPDLVATVDSVPNDRYFDRQTNLWTPQQAQPNSAGDAESKEPVRTYSIDAPTIWDATRGRRSVVVAVVDGGIVTHADLKGQTVPGYDMIADRRNAKDGTGRDADPTDPGTASNGTSCEAHRSSWHGTHVAGIIAALGNNGLGISGIAPGVALQPVRVVGQCGAAMSDVIAGIRWAAGGTVPGVPRNKTPADVINLSVGSTVDDYTCPQAVQDVIDEAVARGVVVVASAGNQGKSVLTRTPANCAGVFSVGAMSLDGRPTTYTNAGRTIGIMAPGGDVDDGIWSTVDAGTAGPTRSTYGQMAGTSMAAPTVAAAAALVRSLGSFTNQQVVDVLRRSAVKPLRADGYYTCLSDDPTTGAERTVCGAGILNLAAIPAPVGTPSITGSAKVGSTVSFTPGRWNGRPDSVTHQWLRDGTAIAGETGTTYALTKTDLGRTLTVRSTAHTEGYPDFSGLTAAKVVPKATARVALRLSATRAKAKRTRLWATVKVTPGLGQTPAGSVQVYVDGRRVRTTALKSGTVRMRLTTFPRSGRHRVRVRYLGTSRVAATWSSTLRVTVRK